MTATVLPAARLTAALLTTSPALTTSLLLGTAVATRPHPRGQVALLAPGELALYFVRASRARAFLFRTLAAPEPITTLVPGVSEPVRLLVETASLDRSSKLARALRYLRAKGRNPSALSDDFYLRIHALLDGKLPRHKILHHLLADEDVASACP
jgi:hypothetical protein